MARRPAERLLCEIEHFEAEIWRVAQEAGCTESAIESALQGWGDELGEDMPSSGKYVAGWQAVHALRAVRAVRAALNAATSDDAADQIARAIELGQTLQQGWAGLYFPKLRGRLAALAGKNKFGSVGPLRKTLEIIFAGVPPSTNAEALGRLKQLADPDCEEMGDLFEHPEHPSPWEVIEVDDTHVVFREHGGKERPIAYKTIYNALTDLRKDQ